ncbi:MAG: NUDIX hydrolase [Anaerolineae bacterium]
MIEEVGIDVVREALAQPRPGLRAQIGMSPRPRASVAINTPARAGGVLLLLYPINGRLHLVLTRRAEHLSSHKGQISLPGGAQDPGESFEQTALREVQEELNVEPADIQVLGRLTPLYISPSNYCIRPVVGYTPVRPAFHPDSCEVAEVLEIPLAVLLDPSIVREEDWRLRGIQVQVPFFEVKGHKVWGATAMVLAEFVELMRSVMDLKRNPTPE